MEYLIFQNEISKDTNDTIKKYLLEHHESENIIKANDLIKNIILKYSEDKNNEKLNEEISNILFKFVLTIY